MEKLNTGKSKKKLESFADRAMKEEKVPSAVPDASIDFKTRLNLEKLKSGMPKKSASDEIKKKSTSYDTPTHKKESYGLMYTPNAKVDYSKSGKENEDRIFKEMMSTDGISGSLDKKKKKK